MKEQSKHIIKRCFRWIGQAVLILFCSSLLAVVAYRYVPVYYTPLMFIRAFEQVRAGEAVKVNHDWVPLSRIAQPLVQAVVASEDNLFPQHNGFDMDQIQKAMEEAEKGIRVRGGSTISQQTAKNVFLWPGKNYIRKGLEAYFTLLIEWIWGKERIMEVYLNSIEMGKGIYGAEAVARAHFGKQAFELTRQDAALIAATLPNPVRYNSAHPSPYVLKRQGQILSLMGKLLKIDMGYTGASKNDRPESTKKRKKWRASLTTTSDGSPTAKA